MDSHNHLKDGRTNEDCDLDSDDYWNQEGAFEEATDKDDNLTEVKGEATVTIQGMLAQFGSRMVEDVSNQLFIQFTKSLSSKLEGKGALEENIDNQDNSLSGAMVASAAIKGISGRFMDKIRGKKKNS